MWEAEQLGRTIDEQMDAYAAAEEGSRAESGPPAAYDAGEFGEGNIYLGPALMWHELRERIGDDAFFRLMREWPTARDNRAPTATTTGPGSRSRPARSSPSFFDAWLLGETTPPRD